MQQKNALDEQQQALQKSKAPETKWRDGRMGDSEYEEYERLAQERFRRNLLDRIRRDEKTVSHFDIMEAEEIAKQDPAFAAQLAEARENGVKKQRVKTVIEDVVPEKISKFEQLKKMRESGGQPQQLSQVAQFQEPVQPCNCEEQIEPQLLSNAPVASVEEQSYQQKTQPWEMSPAALQTQMTSTMFAMMQDLQRQQQTMALLQDQQKAAQISDLQTQLHQMQMRMLEQEQQQSRRELEKELERLRIIQQQRQQSQYSSGYAPSSQKAPGRPLVFQTKSGLTQDTLEARNAQRRRLLALLEREFPQ